MKRIAVILCATIFSFGCSKETPNIEDLFSTEINLKTNRVIKIHADYVHLEVMRVFAVDKYMVLQCFMNEKHIYIYDLDSAKLANEMYFVGRGPNEMVTISSVYPYKNGVFSYIDGSQGIVINDSIYDGCEKFSTKIKIPVSNNRYQRIAPLNDSVSVANGVFPDTEKQFALLNDKFESIKYFDDFPDTDGDLNHPDLVMGFQGEITNTDNGFVYTSIFGNVLKFFEYNNSDIFKIKEYLFNVPKFYPESKGTMQSARQDRKNIQGNLSVTASEDEYFMLFSNEFLANPQRESNIIYCYNQDGSPNRKITLDREVEYIAYSKKLDKLYAVGSEDDLQNIYEIIQ